MSILFLRLCIGIDGKARHITNVSFRVPYFAVAHNMKYAQKDTQANPVNSFLSVMFALFPYRLKSTSGNENDNTHGIKVVCVLSLQVFKMVQKDMVQTSVICVFCEFL